MTEDTTTAPLPARALLDPAVIDDPYAFYDTLRQDAPVWLVPGSDLVVVTSFAAISDAVSRPEDFSSNIRGLVYRDGDGNPCVTPYGDETTNVLATADPPLHTRHRATVFPELVNKRMRELRGDVEALSDAHLSPSLEHGSFDFMARVANAVPIRVVSRLIGWHDEDPDELLAAAFASTEILSANRSLEEINSAVERTAAVAGWIAEQLNAAIAEPPDEGLLAVIARAVAIGEIGYAAGLIMMHTLLSAGGESTTSLLGNAVHLLATDATLQDRLRHEPELRTPFIEETLRLESPFRYHMRHAQRTAELQGTVVPEGATVLLMWGAANRDPEEYDRPNDVVLDRRGARHHLGFGRGIHLCVGAPLARLEADVIIGQLLDRTSRFTLDPSAPPQREDSLMVRRFTALPLLTEPA